MKKIIAVVVMGIFALALCGCQSNVDNLKYPTINDGRTDNVQTPYVGGDAEVQDISMQNELTDGMTSTADNVKNSGNAAANGINSTADNIKDAGNAAMNGIGSTVNNIKNAGNEAMEDIASAMDGDKNTRTQDENMPNPEPSYIRFYTPLSPIPFDWYGKYHIITDFQFF